MKILVGTGEKELIMVAKQAECCEGNPGVIVATRDSDSKYIFIRGVKDTHKVLSSLYSNDKVYIPEGEIMKPDAVKKMLNIKSPSGLPS